MPVCNYCGKVHDGTKPVCPYCHHKVETVPDDPVYSLDTNAVDAAKKSKLFAALAFTGCAFFPLALIFGAIAIKKSKLVKEGMYLREALQGRRIAITAILLSFVVTCITLALYGNVVFEKIADIIDFIVNGPASLQ
ncbi:MAG TPA: hypothetical protein PLT66_02200 [Bacillota bacterium]|nr:hypothetical protein [Bacillota bacterium]